MSERRRVAAVHRSTRQALVDDVPRTRGVPNKRDTKRWCKGKVGVEHALAVKPLGVLKNWHGVYSRHGTLVRYCSTCGKELAMYFPPWPNSPPASLYRKPHVVPDWAAEFFADHPEARPV